MKFKIIDVDITKSQITIENETGNRIFYKCDVKTIARDLGQTKTLTYKKTADWLIGKEVDFYLQKETIETKLKKIIMKRNWYAKLGISKAMAYKYKRSLLAGTMHTATMKKLLDRLK